MANRGFTLIEVLIAMGIMTLVFGVSFMVQSNSISATERARSMSFVAMLAKRKMVETELEIEGKAFSEVKEEETGKFDAPYENFTWTREIKEVEFPNITAGALAGEDTGQTTEEETFGKLVTQFLSEAIREVVVTISWEEDKGIRNFSLATYWVDLNSEFKITL